jgi:hypothetical protein
LTKSFTDFLSYLENMVAICPTNKVISFWEKAFTHTPFAWVKQVISLCCLRGNLCLSHACLSTICLNNSDLLFDWFLRPRYMCVLIYLCRSYLCCPTFPISAWCFIQSFCFKLIDFITLFYHGPSETFRGSNFCCNGFSLLCFTLCYKKGE